VLASVCVTPFVVAGMADNFSWRKMDGEKRAGGKGELFFAIHFSPSSASLLAVSSDWAITLPMSKTLLTFVEDIYEDLELWYPLLRLQEAGYAMRLAAPEIRTYAGKNGYPATSDLLLADARSQDFCGLLVPGGFMPDKLRRDARVLSLTREFFEQGKLVAFICHGGWIPISAKILHGRRVTGSLGIKDDLENAGGVWVNEPVVVDGNLISSRTPRDLAPFAKALVDFLQAKLP
jgi:protease I